MAKREDNDFEILTAVLARHPDGASLEVIQDEAALPASERTLIRRLASMVERGIASKSGGSRAARYSLVKGAAPAAAAVVETPASVPSPADTVIPLSKAGSEIVKLVTRPRAARKPVSYNREFLSSYVPNVTRYLTAADRKRLEAISKTVDAADQKAGTYAQRILSRLLIDLSFNSSRLEGNTYSLLDTKRLIEAGEPAEGHDATEAQMILNHKAAIEFLVQSAEDISFNRITILNLHALLAENLLPDPSAAGRIRQIPVTIGQSVYQPLDVPQLINEIFMELLAKASAIEDPFEQAFFVMVHLPYLQPFEDVNKRVSRLAANIPLFKRNLAPISFIDVPDDTYTYGMLGVYELNRYDLIRDVFLWAYERSAARYAAIRQAQGEPDQFRLRYRQELKQVVSDVIREPMNQKQAARYVNKWTRDHIPENERARFVEIAETELMAIHEGNFARYQIRPSEFHAWHKLWHAEPARKSRAGRTGQDNK